MKLFLIVTTKLSNIGGFRANNESLWSTEKNVITSERFMVTSSAGGYQRELASHHYHTHIGQRLKVLLASHTRFQETSLN